MNQDIQETEECDIFLNEFPGMELAGRVRGQRGRSLPHFSDWRGNTILLSPNFWPPKFVIIFTNQHDVYSTL